MSSYLFPFCSLICLIAFAELVTLHYAWDGDVSTVYPFHPFGAAGARN